MNSCIRKMIWVTFQRKGIHYFPGASAPEFRDVSYLSLAHRHLFKFKVGIQVYHDDREIEFHQFLNWLESLYDSNLLGLNHLSCEMIADQLFGHILEKYPNRPRRVDIEVSEDGECGVTAQYEIIGGYSTAISDAFNSGGRD